MACAAPRRSAWQPRTVLLAPLAAPSGQIENQMFSQQRRAAPAGQTAPPSTPDGGGRTVPRRRGICRARARILRLVSHHHSLPSSFGTKELTLGAVDLFGPKKCRIPPFRDFGEIEFGIDSCILNFRRRIIKTKEFVFCSILVGFQVF